MAFPFIAVTIKSGNKKGQ